MTKKLLSKNFDMKDLGEADVILGIEILQKETRLMLTLSHYIKKILKRPDTAYVVGRLSRHTSSPGKEHWDVVNLVFKRFKKTIDYGLEYSGDPSVLEVSWGSKKQSCLTDSTMEAEFMTLASCCKEAEWLRDLLINIPLWPKPMPSIFAHCDSPSTLSRAYNQVYNVFIGEWNNNNIQTLLSALRCFYLASGLKINLHKSKLMGIGVSSNVVAAAASLIGCSILTTLFNYLGVKVGSNMSRIISWDDVISKVSSRLSKWKLKLLSIGGHLSL
uniref:Zinc finger, CCHC-type n=1 Tax=Tanacetum cinerariifolium TaxID=118510 RepID=A0A699HCJ1_TANCI|nr:zinc finger, CCHC-type [Tanacetum cinerariifolium]